MNFSLKFIEFTQVSGLEIRPNFKLTCFQMCQGHCRMLSLALYLLCVGVILRQHVFHRWWIYLTFPQLSNATGTFCKLVS